MDGSGGLFLAGGQTRWKESGPGGRGLSRLLDEAARWEIGAIRVKKIRTATEKLKPNRTKDVGDSTDFQRKRSSVTSTNI